MSPRQGRSRFSSPRQHLWDEAVLHLAQLGRKHLWRLTVGTTWMELRDEAGWVLLEFFPGDRYLIQVGSDSSEEMKEQHATDNYAHALETVERLASRS